MSGPRGVFSYASDNGTVYRVSIDASNAAAGGFIAAAGSPNKPTNMKMRYILAQHPTTFRERKVYCSTPANALFVDALDVAETVDLEDFGSSPSVTTTYNVRGRIGERRFSR